MHPIETAPHDRRIMVWTPNVHRSPNDSELGWWTQTRWSSVTERLRLGTATHWIEYPPAPGEKPVEEPGDDVLVLLGIDPDRRLATHANILALDEKVTDLQDSVARLIGYHVGSTRAQVHAEEKGPPMDSPPCTCGGGLGGQPHTAMCYLA